jgi:cephalosporin-C deacetylase-like acetyl esterase
MRRLCGRKETDLSKNGYQHMVLEHYVERVREIHSQRRKRLQQIANHDEAEDYRQHVRDAIRRAFSPIPPKTPLHAQVAGVIERPSHRIEKVTFESRPGCLVTGNLYVPHHLEAPAPCVLGSCGHSEDGKASDLYQEFCQRLAYAGFVVLIYDPFSQGERDQYFGLEERDLLGWGTSAHNMMGKQLELLDENFCMWRAWDGVRALDYLLSRPEVDSARVGVTGNSGGGTMTTWLWAIDDRFTMAAPGCFVTTFLHNLENELPGDAEQCPPGVLGECIEMADFAIAAAPKPILLMGQQYDYFDRRGLRQAYQDIRQFYEVYGAPADNVDLFIGPQGHGFSAHNQQAMVSFFARHAGVEPVQIPETETLEAKMLHATPHGQVIQAGATPIYTMIGEKARDLGARQQPLDGNALRDGVAELLSLPAQRPAAHYRNLRPVRLGTQTFARTSIETERGIRAILWKCLAQPEYAYSLDVETHMRLYLPHISSESDLTEEPWAVSLSASPPVYALDVRGLGESMPEEQHPGFFQPYGMDYMFHAYGNMLGESYLGRRIYDVLCTLDLLVHEGAASISLHGRGQGAILALFAAMFHEQVTFLALKNAPSTWGEWAQTPLVAWPAANFVRGMLKLGDLPDCLRVVRERISDANVQISDPWGPTMQPI